jgi:hypothetical protein
LDHFSARFDVMREMNGKEKFTVGAVVKVDFNGKSKRVLFHFAKTRSSKDEWIEFGSPRIFQLYSKVTPPNKGTSAMKPSPATNQKIESWPEEREKKLPPAADGKVEGSSYKKRKACIASPFDEGSFVIGGKSVDASNM